MSLLNRQDGEEGPTFDVNVGPFSRVIWKLGRALFAGDDEEKRLRVQLLRLQLGELVGDPIPVQVGLDLVVKELGVPCNWFVVGDPGGGKSAFGFRLGELYKELYDLQVVAYGVPRWACERLGVGVVEDLQELPADSVVVVDETGLGFGGRSEKARRKLLRPVMALRRHGDVVLVFVAQSGRMVDPEAWSGGGVLAVKRLDSLGSRFEREQILDDMARALRIQASLEFGLEDVLLRIGQQWALARSGLPGGWDEEVSKCHRTRFLG